MSFNDPIADMLTRIRNAVRAEHPQVAMPSSKMKVSIAKILAEEGFISSYVTKDIEDSAHKTLTLDLKYVGKRRTKRSVITNLERVSLPGQRIYAGRIIGNRKHDYHQRFSKKRHSNTFATIDCSSNP